MDEIRESRGSDRLARSWAEISLPSLEHNLSVIRSLIPPKTDIIAVVKANAYGHGIEKVAKRAWKLGIKSFAVADPIEALHLRSLLPESEITVFGGCRKGEEELFRSARLTAAVYNLGEISPDIRIQIKVDTGMGRLGIPWGRLKESAPQIKGRVTGVYATLASADTDPEFSRLQIDRFLHATEGMKVRRHICNSAGLRFSEGHLESVRPGLAIYGIAMVPELNSLRPVLEWKTKILALNDMNPGSTLGYGSTFKTARKSSIAVLPMGYADGYNRLLSNQGKVEIKSKLFPVVGRISMDLTLVDVTDDPDIKVGDEVKLISSDPSSSISALALAQQLNTIPYEILTTIGSRVERVFKDRDTTEPLKAGQA
jgi:alanine racemase